MIGPDPDGTGGLKHRARRFAYNRDGQVTKAELGTVNSQSDADWAAMDVLQYADTLYDGNARPWMRRLWGGTSRQAQTQFSYDALGRLQCVAVRMDRDQFTASASLSACTLGANTDPIDRLTRLYYDAVGRHNKTLAGWQSDAQAYVETRLFTPNGKLVYLIDGNGNRTTYLYDGFDRLATIRYPVETPGTNASNPDTPRSSPMTPTATSPASPTAPARPSASPTMR